jgi:hypothetical protein
MKRLFIIILSVLVIGALNAPIIADSDLAHSSRHVRVMTQNLYVGADLERIAKAQQVDPALVPVTVAEVFQTILDTNFKERTEAIAPEIGHLRPANRYLCLNTLYTVL